MTKANKWCSHPIRHAGARKVGRSPSHPKGIYRASLQLMKFLNQQYGATGINSSQLNMGKFYICTRCYEYEMDRMKSTRNFSSNLELVNNGNESAEDMELRLSIDSLHMQDISEVTTPQGTEGGKSELLSEDGLALSHSQNVVKEVLNDVFRILKIPTITDIRNTEKLFNQVNRACEMLHTMCENLLHNNKKKKNTEPPENDNLLLLTLSEKNELIGGIKKLYNASDKLEQVRLLTIAPAHWGRQRLQNFFDSSERQARKSLEIRTSEGILSNPENLRGNQPLDKSVIEAVIKFYEQDWISRVSPNKSDVLTIKKQPVAKRFMLLTISEAYEGFKNDFSQCKIGRSKFFELKPRHVKPIQLHDTCCYFAQNFALLSQREVQSAHFDKPQTTVFTALVVVGSEHRNFVIISDYVEHFVYFAQQIMVSNVKQLAPNVRVINYVTDGGPSHLKNRYNILNLTFHEMDFGVRAMWSFTATSRGKGSVDGLGAAIKSTATIYLMRHGPEEAFKNANEFYNFSVKQQQSSKSRIVVLYAESKEIERLHQEKNMKRWENINGK
ncbi:unnamed protein product [Rotaria sp. Silwood1]|nr:unnamed protein product [Rotaria sp. Silwood1]